MYDGGKQASRIPKPVASLTAGPQAGSKKKKSINAIAPAVPRQARPHAASGLDRWKRAMGRTTAAVATPAGALLLAAGPVEDLVGVVLVEVLVADGGVSQLRLMSPKTQAR